MKRSPLFWVLVNYWTPHHPHQKRQSLTRGRPIGDVVRNKMIDVTLEMEGNENQSMSHYKRRPNTDGEDTPLFTLYLRVERVERLTISNSSNSRASSRVPLCPIISCHRLRFCQRSPPFTSYSFLISPSFSHQLDRSHQLPMLSLLNTPVHLEQPNADHFRRSWWCQWIPSQEWHQIHLMKSVW